MLQGQLSRLAPPANEPVVESGPAVNEFRLNSGESYKGEVSSPNEQGLVIKLDIGGFSERIAWAKFTQETLKRLAGRKDTARYARPYVVEITQAVKAQLKKRQAQRKLSFTPKPAPKIDLPSKNAEFIASVTTPFNLAVIALLFIGNLYVAYEVAVFRNRPAALVCGLSALLPGVGPLIFLSLPSREVVYEAEEPVAMNVPDHAPAKHTDINSSLSMAKGAKGETNALQPATFTRADTTFNRRFFETRFPGYFRVVLGDAEKSMVIVVKTPRDQYIAQRIARITSNEMHVQLVRGGEVGITIGEITEVQFRPKDAAA